MDQCDLENTLIMIALNDFILPYNRLDFLILKHAVLLAHFAAHECLNLLLPKVGFFLFLHFETAIHFSIGFAILFLQFYKILLILSLLTLSASLQLAPIIQNTLFDIHITLSLSFLLFPIGYFLLNLVFWIILSLTQL